MAMLVGTERRFEWTVVARVAGAMPPFEGCPGFLACQNTTVLDEQFMAASRLDDDISNPWVTVMLRDEVLALEQARLDALNRNDLEAVAQLMSPDLVHVHATGAVEDLAQYL